MIWRRLYVLSGIALKWIEMMWVYDGVVFFNFVSQPFSHLPESWYIYNIRDVGGLASFLSCHSPLDMKYFACWSNTRDFQWLFCNQYSQQQNLRISKIRNIKTHLKKFLKTAGFLVRNHTELTLVSLHFQASRCHGTPQGCCCPNCRQERQGLIRPVEGIW